MQIEFAHILLHVCTASRTNFYINFRVSGKPLTLSRGNQAIFKQKFYNMNGWFYSPKSYKSLNFTYKAENLPKILCEAIHFTSITNAIKYIFHSLCHVMGFEKYPIKA